MCGLCKVGGEVVELVVDERIDAEMRSAREVEVRDSHYIFPPLSVPFWRIRHLDAKIYKQQGLRRQDK